MAQSRFDIQKSVTESIINKIEKGGLEPWKCPWTKSGESPIPNNFATGQNYNGMNIVILWMEAGEKGYTRNRWLTFNQAKKLGAKVRKGEKSVKCIFYKLVEVEENKKGEKNQIIPVLNVFSLFNVDQIDGLDLPEIQYEPRFADYEPVRVLKQLSEKINLKTVRYGGDLAFYSPYSDFIQLPTDFDTADAHSATFAHELVHATGHSSRLDRFSGEIKGIGSRKDSSYAFEELVAEMGAAFVCAELGIDSRNDQHASYLDFWLEKLKGDNKFLFKAAAQAAKAHSFLFDKFDVSCVGDFTTQRESNLTVNV